MTKISNQYSLTNVLFADAVNGRVGIGTSSPTVPLDVVGAGKFSTTVTAQTGFKLPANGNGTSPTLAYNNSLGFGVSGTGIFFGNLYNSDLSTAMQLRVTNAGGTDITAMTITPTGNVGIGTSSPENITNQTSLSVNGTNASRLDFQILGTKNSGLVSTAAGLYLETSTTIPLVFITNNTERMRITSGGDVGIGTTTPTEIFNVYTAQVKWLVNLQHGYSTQFFVNFLNPGGSQVGSIMGNGTNTSYNTNSDYRLKEDLKPINGIDILSKIKVYDFKWKSDNSRMDGVIAHELQEVLPYAVSGIKDGKEMQGVDYSKIVPVLISSIQEQQTQINELKALLNA